MCYETKSTELFVTTSYFRFRNSKGFGKNRGEDKGETKLVGVIGSNKNGGKIVGTKGKMKKNRGERK